MFAMLKALKQHGVLGINQRNAGLIMRYNERRLFPIVDDKLQTKRLAMQVGMAIPELYASIETVHDIKNLAEILKPYDDFAVKPAHGAGGEGILIISGKIKDFYRQINGNLIKQADLEYHISNILAGIHSLGGYADTAIIEYCVKIDPTFAAVSYQGIPDLRIITLRGYPVMAMARLPTHISGGKANLHQGAVGVGIDLATGTTLGGVWYNDPIDYHPDTLKPIDGIQIPCWDDVLMIAANCYELTGLGYLGVDIVLDKNYGPLMLESNARPGLNIQIANRQGLQQRFAQIEKYITQKANATDRIALIKKLFKT
ncbi:MAG: alpha-L-glutamate ligase-like protein [Gammaproteobacteria bacterium]